MAAAGAAPTVEELMQQLEAEKKKSGMLEARNVEMRKRMGIQQTALEAEEELITNKLISRIEEIEKEKEHVSLRVEEEENQLRCPTVHLPRPAPPVPKLLPPISRPKRVKRSLGFWGGPRRRGAQGWIPFAGARKRSWRASCSTTPRTSRA